MEVQIARTHAELARAYERFSVARHIGCDTETSSLSPQTGKLFSVQFSDGEFSVLVPVSEGVKLGVLSEILSNPDIVKIFHNARFDLQFLSANSFTVENVFCTMVAEKLITKGANQSSSLAETLYRYFGVDLDKSQRKKFNKTWNGIWEEELINYALADVVHLPNLMKEQTEWLERLGLLGEFARQMESIR